MNKTIRILLLSVLITISAAACSSSRITLEENAQAVQTTDTGALEETTDLPGAIETAAEDTAAAASPAEAGDTAEAHAETDAPQRVCVYVCGEVNSPGVYELAADARIYEALTLAGGLTAEADAAVVNQAQQLTDGMMIRIPAKGENEEALPVLSGAASADPGGSVAADDGLVNINTADAQALTALPGIGDAKAAAIVEYREQNGSYTSKEELMNVSGIGEATYRNLESRITVGS